MGLDAVEIVMAVEQVFDIEITDTEAGQIRTPGDLIALVWAKVASGPTETACLTQRGFNRVRAVLRRRLGVERREVRPETPLAPLLPRPIRRELLRQILTDLEVGTLPGLERPAAIQGAIVLGSAGAGLVVMVSPIPHALIAMWGVFVGVAWVGVWLTRGWRTEFAASQATVGGLARWVVAQRPPWLGVAPGTWTRALVAEKVREVVIEVVGCAETYREDARFIEDLGVD
jgi:acyl carrier protein